MADRNSLQYARDEVGWYASQAEGATAWQTLVGWAYYGPVLVVSLFWWAITRLVGIPYAGLCRLWRGLRRAGRR